jgi:AraC-like DNA-binding protein
LFKCPVAFSSDRNAIILRSADLDQPMPGADPGFRANVPRPATSPLVVGRAISPQQVKQALAVLMPRGECTSVAVSHRLGVDRRTLHRHLTRAGVDFSTVLAEMRSELVAQYVKADTLSMTAIGELLGFTSLSSYSRWFRSAFGCAPTRWRVD